MSTNLKHRQHYVCQAYLRGWATDEKLWVLQYGVIRRAPTRDVAVKRHFYKLQALTNTDRTISQGLDFDKSQHEEKLVRRYHERYHWPLAVAIVLLLVEMLFPERKREPIGKAAAAGLQAQPALRTAATALLLLLLLPTAFRATG